MIRIYKDNDIKLVTQGVYKNLYEPLGYKPVIEEKKETKVVQPTKIKTEEPKETKESSKDIKTNKNNKK